MRLKESQIRSLVKITKKSPDGKNLYGVCPKCGHNEFGISLVKNNHPFGCFRKKSCGYSSKSILDLIKFLNREDILVGSEYEILPELIEMKPIVEEKFLFKEETLPEKKEPMGFKRVYSNYYLEQRGYTKKDFQNYKVGYTKLVRKLRDYIIIMIPQEKRYVTYISRTTLSKEECEKNNVKRYLNPTSDPISKIIDGLDEVSSYEDITVVEGHFDRINVRNAYNALGIKSFCVSTLGARITEHQISILKNRGVKTLRLFFDPDVLKIIDKEMAKTLSYFDNVFAMTPIISQKDPGDMSFEEIGDCFFNSKSFFIFTVHCLVNKL